VIENPQPSEESWQPRPRFNAQPARHIKSRPHTNRAMPDRRSNRRRASGNSAMPRSAAPSARCGPALRAQDNLRLLRTRRYSSASISVIPSRWASRSSLWRRASLASAGRFSAMNMTASSGPPSPTRSSVRGRRSRPGGRRLTLRSGFFKRTHPNWRILNNYPQKERVPRVVICNLLDSGIDGAHPLSTSLYLTGAGSAPMFRPRRLTRIPRNRSHFSP